MLYIFLTPKYRAYIVAGTLLLIVLLLGTLFYFSTSRHENDVSKNVTITQDPIVLNTMNSTESDTAENINDSDKSSFPEISKPTTTTPTLTENTPVVPKAQALPKHTESEPWPTSSADASPQTKPESSLTAFSTTAMLGAHNAVRSAVGVAPLVWSDTLSKSASTWATTLQNADCDMYHDSKNSTYGENLYMRWTTNGGKGKLISSPEQVVSSWAEEDRNYTYTTNSCEPGEVCGHYTQIVWADTKQVGCAVRSCIDDSKQTDIWVCRYDPSGNWIGEKPY